MLYISQTRMTIVYNTCLEIKKKKKFTGSSTNWFLLRCIIHSNNLALICITLRESISSRLFKTLDLSHLVDSLSETIHPWPIIGKIELLNFLNIMIAASTIQSFVAR